MARHKRNCKSYLYTQCKPPKKSFDEFCVENCKIEFLLKNTHAKTKSNSKREKVNILKMIRTILTNVLLVGLD